MVARSVIFALFVLPAVAGAQENPPPKPFDLYLYSSSDPLTKRVISAQLADRRSGGVVSAVLLSPASETSLPKVDVQGRATPSGGLALPQSAMPSASFAAPRAAFVEADLRDGVASAKAKGAPVLPVKFVKRSLAADQLYSVVEQMNRSAEKSAADKAWDNRHESAPKTPGR